MWRTDLKRPWWWETLKAGGEGDDREWDGWMVSPPQWTWFWVSSGSCTGKPGVLQSMVITKSQTWLSESKVTQSCPTLCDPKDSTVHEILQARILDWVAFPFSRRSSQTRDWTQVSCTVGRFFTSWATKEAWGGVLYRATVGLPDPGIKPESHELQGDSLPTELSGNWIFHCIVNSFDHLPKTVAKIR